jgi:hypothetical protein
MELPFVRFSEHHNFKMERHFVEHGYGFLCLRRLRNVLIKKDIKYGRTLDDITFILMLCAVDIYENRMKSSIIKALNV